jgi:hypothetical protein
MNRAGFRVTEMIVQSMVTMERAARQIAFTMEKIAVGSEQHRG